jgi:hypothetical protein
MVDAVLQGGSDSRTVVTNTDDSRLATHACHAVLQASHWSPSDPENPNRVVMDGEIEAWQQNTEQAGGMKDIAVLSPTQYGMSISPKREMHVNGSVQCETGQGMVGTARQPLPCLSHTTQIATDLVQVITLTREEWEEVQAAQERQDKERN